MSTIEVVNLVKNPGFEEDPVDAYWSLKVWGTGISLPPDPYSIETVDVYEGRSLKCHVDDPQGNQFSVGQHTQRGLLDPSSLIPGETYTLGIVYKSTSDIRLVLQASEEGVKIIDEKITLPATSVYTLSPLISVVWPDTDTINYIQWFVVQSSVVGEFLIDNAEFIGQVIVPEEPAAFFPRVREMLYPLIPRFFNKIDELRGRTFL